MEWIFSGIGTALVVFFAGVLVERKYLSPSLRKSRQSQHAGNNAVQNQAGRDIR